MFLSKTSKIIRIGSIVFSGDQIEIWDFVQDLSSISLLKMNKNYDQKFQILRKKSPDLIDFQRNFKLTVLEDYLESRAQIWGGFGS